MLAVVAAKPKAANALVAGRKILDDLPGAVTPAVLDQDDFERAADFLQRVDKSHIQLRQDSLRAIDRNDNRQGWHHRLTARRIGVRNTVDKRRSSPHLSSPCDRDTSAPAMATPSRTSPAAANRASRGWASHQE